MISVIVGPFVGALGMSEAMTKISGEYSLSPISFSAETLNLYV